MSIVGPSYSSRRSRRRFSAPASSVAGSAYRLIYVNVSRIEVDNLISSRCPRGHDRPAQLVVNCAQAGVKGVLHFWR
jgi:hypothetical protein